MQTEQKDPEQANEFVYESRWVRLQQFIMNGIPKELYTSEDWWSVWIGFATFIITTILGVEHVEYPHFHEWASNPGDAWNRIVLAPGMLEMNI